MGCETFPGFLHSGFDEAVRDPVWGTISLSAGLARLAAMPEFAVLDRILQLGPAHLVYPGATHTRRAHSLGVFHVARRLLLALGERGSASFVTYTGAISFLAAALCHDLGHFPFAHSLKELPLASHESLAAHMVRSGALSRAVEGADADPWMVAAIIDDSLPDRGDREIRFFRSLLSGVLDPDKLDYLNRDAFFCGVPYGIQDTDFILRRVAVDDDDRLAVDDRGIMSIEGLLFSKYLMYRAVYWHRSVRAATAMLKKAVFAALAEGRLRGDELYGLDDEGFFRLMGARGGIFSSMVEDARAGRLFTVVLEAPFDENLPSHRAALDLERRYALEDSIAKQASIGAEDVTIDIPEPIAFETDLGIVPENPSLPTLPFPRCPTVFTPDVVRGFARSLRRVRVLARGDSSRIFAAARNALG